jgi:hypothetical protein
MKNELTRRHFLGTAAAAGLGLGFSADCRAIEPRVEVCNPLRRTPLSLIIDDSCPVINKAYYWIKQRHDWRLKHEPDAKPSGWEIHYDKLDKMPKHRRRSRPSGANGAAPRAFGANSAWFPSRRESAGSTKASPAFRSRN